MSRPTTVEVQPEGQDEMNTYMMEILAKEWLRERLQEADNGRLLQVSRAAAAARERDAFPRPARLALVARGLAHVASRLALAARRLGLAVRRLARVAATS